MNRIPCFRKGEIWWAHIGENVGIEINGKGEGFYRPVIVMKRLSQFGFVAIPLTSQRHEGSWYVEFEFQNKREYAVLAQLRVLSAARLCNRIGVMSRRDFDLVCAGARRLFS